MALACFHPITLQASPAILLLCASRVPCKSMQGILHEALEDVQGCVSVHFHAYSLP